MSHETELNLNDKRSFQGKLELCNFSLQLAKERCAKFELKKVHSPFYGSDFLFLFT